MKAAWLSIFCCLIASLSCAQNGTPLGRMADLSPVRESLGRSAAAKRKSQRSGGSLQRRSAAQSRNPRSLLGLRESLAAQHEDAGAAWVDREIRSTWETADVELHLGDL